MAKKTVKDIDVKQKKVLVRVDFNVPTKPDGTITDDTRIRGSLPTINYLLGQQARIILCSHLGRPGGKVVQVLRLAPEAKRLSELLKKPVAALNDCIGPQVEDAVSKMLDGDIVLLENLRFYPQEEANDPDFALKLSRLADVYVDDAFGSCHRAHASIVGVARDMPAVAGLLMEKELTTLNGLLGNPDRPFSVMIGGAKVSTKTGFLDNVLPKVNFLIIGGGMIATFIKSHGYSAGASAVENDQVDHVLKLREQAKSLGVGLMLPSDLIVAQKLEAGSATRIVSINQVPEGWMIADIGPKTVEAFSRTIKVARLFSGTGLWEYSRFPSLRKALAV